LVHFGNIASSLIPGKGNLISAGAGFLGGALAGACNLLNNNLENLKKTIKEE
jgi:hypothetical protein